MSAMARAQLSSGIELEYETFGSPDDPALLLVMGFTAQLIHWHEDFCRALADTGAFVIRFDNRDAGLSSHLDGQMVDTQAVIVAALGDQPLPPVPYTLSDMAADCVGLLDVLGIDRAHILGASMGGMIAQHVAIEHPTRVLTLTSVMSTTGEPEVGGASPEALAALLAPPPAHREEYIERSSTWATWQSKKYNDDAANRANAALFYDRAFYPEGTTRQLAAIYASGRRNALLPGVTAPTLVIHGRDDDLIGWSGGARTAELIPGSHLLLVGDMGHDFPEPLWPTIIGAIATHIHARHPAVASSI
jgi:pimeloyl-ACP methyl ester carboxylesterase